MPETLPQTILVADDDPIVRSMLVAVLKRSGYDALEASTGYEALAALSSPSGPRIALLDRLMPGLDGTDVVRALRTHGDGSPPYVILLTSLHGRDEIVEGLEAGANDYVQKPFHPGELLARVRAGVRMVELQDALHARVQQLEAAAKEIQTLHGILPICACCKSIRDDEGYWKKVEDYIRDRTDAEFTHGYCPECAAKLLKELDATPGDQDR